MGIMAIVGVFLSLLNAQREINESHSANIRQMEHDKAMAELNHRYREEEAISSMEREANYNQYEIEKNKMLSAGFSPSLMYGNMQASVPSISSVGSNQGAGNVSKTPDLSKFFGKLDPAEYSSQAIERMNAQTMKDRTKSDILKNNQDILESISRTNENIRNTAYKKSIEDTLRRQEQATLNNLELQGKTLDFDLSYARERKPLEMQKLSLENESLIKKIDLTAEEILTQKSTRAKLAADIRVANEQVNYYHTGALENVASTREIKERTHTATLNRVMKEVGLNARSIDIGSRTWTNILPAHKERMKAASILLQECGFSAEEANTAVLYYSATDPKDVNPSSVNALSRIITGAIK